MNMAKRVARLGFLILFLGWIPTLHADDFTSPSKRLPMRFTSRLDTQIPLTLDFVNEDGTPVKLETLFQRKPVILNLVYFNCPMMCTEVLNGLVQTMKKMPLDLGKDYNVITLSIDDREKPPLAKAKRALYLDRYHRADAGPGWSFLTGDKIAIQTLADAVGFRYKYYADIDQYDHALGLVILTPSGKVAGYLKGVRFKPEELRKALIQAAH